MTDTGWVIVKQLLDEALELAPEKRALFQDRVCASNPDLGAELESLLMAAQNLSADFLLSPMSGEMKVSVQTLEFTGRMSAGELLAQRFRLIENFGEGGMGQVWLAEQNSPVKRQVALLNPPNRGEEHNGCLAGVHNFFSPWRSAARHDFKSPSTVAASRCSGKAF